VADQKRVIVTGATGLIGRSLVQALLRHGYAPVLFSRRPDVARRSLPGAAAHVAWTPGLAGAWSSAIDGAYAVVSLAGAPLFPRRWTAAYKREILDSRVTGTQGLVRAIAHARVKPRVLLSASGIGYYGFRDATPLAESAPPGDDFLARLCVQWEVAAREAEPLGVRVVPLRIGIVLARQGGALIPLVLPMRCFVGGPILPGDQWVSWIHLDDLIGAMLLALEDDRADGPINVVAPDARTNRDFSATLGRAISRPSWLPVPGFALRLALGEFAETLTTGQRVLPAQLSALGYAFQYPLLDSALSHLLHSERT
jgi:uncharacterized protein (TIGR01777 family)